MIAPDLLLDLLETGDDKLPDALAAEINLHSYTSQGSIAGKSHGTAPDT